MPDVCGGCCWRVIYVNAFDAVRSADIVRVVRAGNGSGGVMSSVDVNYPQSSDRSGRQTEIQNINLNSFYKAVDIELGIILLSGLFTQNGNGPE